MSTPEEVIDATRSALEVATHLGAAMDELLADATVRLSLDQRAELHHARTANQRTMAALSLAVRAGLFEAKPHEGAPIAKTPEIIDLGEALKRSVGQ